VGEMNDNLRKKTIALIFVTSAVFLVLIGVNVFQFYSNKIKIERMEKMFSEEYLEMNSLLPETFKQKVVSGEKFVALIGRPGCPSCRTISHDFIELLGNHELKAKIYYVNVTSIRKSGDDPEWVKFKSDYGNIPGTPALVLADGGKITSSVSWTDDGDLTVATIESWLRDIGYILKPR
jgi:predicted bacteriocin transport accessory protein